MTRLFICRHVDPSSPDAADELAGALAATELDAIYTSPLRRAALTAAAVACGRGLSPIEVDDLREIDFGDVDGVPFDSLPAELQTGLLERPTDVRFPGGETFEDLQRRAVAAFAEIVSHRAESTVLVVTHAGVIRAALAAWLLVEDEAVFRIDQRRGAINIVDWIDGNPWIRLLNGARTYP